MSKFPALGKYWLNVSCYQYHYYDCYYCAERTHLQVELALREGHTVASTILFSSAQISHIYVWSLLKLATFTFRNHLRGFQLVRFPAAQRMLMSWCFFLWPGWWSDNSGKKRTFINIKHWRETRKIERAERKDWRGWLPTWSWSRERSLV